MIAKRIESIKPSITLDLNVKAEELQSKGINIINLTAGQPDFFMPKNIQDAAKKAVDINYTKYTDVAGCIELKKAIVNKLKRDNNLVYSSDEIIVSNGAKHSLYNLFQAIINPYDEVIILKPYWTSYPEIVKLAGGKPVFVNSDKNFKPIINELKKSINKKTKAIIVNSPNNPTGTLLNKKELQEIVDICLEKNILIVSDEIYEKIVYDQEFVSIAGLGDEIKKRTVVINGVSKSYSMTGMRIGYAAGSKEIISAMKKVQSHSTSNPNSIAQKASIEALNGSQKFIKEWIDEFKNRRNFIVDELNSVAGIECVKPEGAFYVFPKVSDLFNKNINSSMKLCDELLEKAKIIVVPGEVFGSPEHIRISYATSMDNLKEAVKRIKEFLQ
ncbi:MAG: pyridoxal phosphate-dependent aminotransferase [archaeon]